MTNKKKKAIRKTEKSLPPNKDGVKPMAEPAQGDFDFGGFPKDIDLKKNIGCGG